MCTFAQSNQRAFISYDGIERENNSTSQADVLGLWAQTRRHRRYLQRTAYIEEDFLHRLQNQKRTHRRDIEERTHREKKDGRDCRQRQYNRISDIEDQYIPQQASTRRRKVFPNPLRYEKILLRALRQTLSADKRRRRSKYAQHPQYGHCTRVVSRRYGPYAYKKTHKRDILQYVGVLKYEQNTVYTHDGLLYGHYVPHRVQQQRIGVL